MAKRTRSKAQKEEPQAAAEAAPRQQLPPALAANVWKPGQSGNPNGRQKGSRNKLSEAFLSAMLEDFNQAAETQGISAGKEAIARVRKEDPSTYLRVIGQLMPKEVHIKEDVLDAFDDDELSAAMAAIAALRQARGAGEGDSVQAAGAAGQKPH